MLQPILDAFRAHTYILFTLIFPILILYRFVVVCCLASPLQKIPGPVSYAITGWRLALEDWKGTRTQTILKLHAQYGPVVRIGPSEVAFNSLSALQTIYGAGSGYERTSFYRMFDVYGRQNLFTFKSSHEHGQRKKLVNHAYSKSNIVKDKALAAAVERKSGEYLELLEREAQEGNEIFSSLHYFALDNISHFVYGEGYGATSAMSGDEHDRNLLIDVLDPSRRKLAWFATHLPKYTKWLMSQTGILEKFIGVMGLLPQRKPVVYTGIRRHGLAAWENFKASSTEQKDKLQHSSIMGRLWKVHDSIKQGGLSDMDIASECADHLLAGVDTTSDTMMFLIWALSLPKNARFQEKLAEEVSAMPDSALNEMGVPRVETCDKLPYLDAVIKETLRLYAPLPASEPRSLPTSSVIDSYAIPANTVVSMSPYSLHRNAEIFPNPLQFNPERWLGATDQVKEMKKWFWAFSSGGRMCIGLHLAMAEMTTLTAAIYRKYTTSVKKGMETTSPGITSRFEVFYDVSLPHMEEHVCWVNFSKR
ncbi:putative benzoate 4-monooxygenase cytochrome P450 [Bisporella sp. PMI_857]|nr:putative benzoate 4-monooxygenase cytochrome P450 [Bisporella sp. PMI_857]